MSKKFAISTIETLRQHGFQAYLVGGCVRDLLLGREPADFDVATSATPTQVMETFPETYAVGAQFGVVLVPSPGGECANGEKGTSKSYVVEVATFRSDLGYSDGRHPDEVRFSRDPPEEEKRTTPAGLYQRCPGGIGSSLGIVRLPLWATSGPGSQARSRAAAQRQGIDL